MHIYDMTLYILVDESKLSFHSINGPVKSINPLRWLNFLFHLRRSNRTCAIHTHDHTYMHVGRIKIIIPGFRGNNHDKCLINEIKFLIMIAWPKGVSMVITFRTLHLCVFILTTHDMEKLTGMWFTKTILVLIAGYSHSCLKCSDHCCIVALVSSCQVELSCLAYLCFEF